MYIKAMVVVFLMHVYRITRLINTGEPHHSIILVVTLIDLSCLYQLTAIQRLFLTCAQRKL